MSKAHSPTRFNGEADSFYDSNFTLDMNKRMRVPKSIRVSGDYSDENVNGTNGSSWNQMLANEKFEMHVPDRILVAGQDEYVGTRAPPREIILENSSMPPDPGMIRVQVGNNIMTLQTPPRVLTLNDHFFPAVDEEESNQAASSEQTVTRPSAAYNGQAQVVRHEREQTPTYNALDISLPPTEEVQHLRRQVGKLNRRVMAVELEMMQRQQRDKILYSVALSYFFLKVFFWLSRN